MNIKKLALVFLIISSGLFLSACNLIKGGTGADKTVGQQQTQSRQQQTQSQVTKSANGIIITASDIGFTPAQATVKAQETVTFVNNSNAKIQIGVDPHPTHTGNQELSNGQFVLELLPGESTVVTVAKVGTFGYHDHLNPGMRGKVTVE